MPLRRQLSAWAQAVCSTQLPICDDQLALLGRRQEVGRAAARRSLAVRRRRGLPADQRLAAHRLAAGEREDRLVGEHQLVPGQGVAQPALDLDVACSLRGAGSRRTAPGAVRRPPWPGTSPRRPRAASPRGRCRALRETRYADARQHRDFGRAERERLLDRVQHPLGERQRLASLSMSSARITNSSPPRRATVSLSRISSARRPETRHQQLVPDLVAEVVVDRLELVEVDEQHRHHARGCGAAGRAPAWRGPSAAPGWAACVSGSCSAWRSSQHAVGDVLGGRVPGLAVAARAPQQPAPRAVAVAVAVGEGLRRLRRRARCQERIRASVCSTSSGWMNSLDRLRQQLLAGPARAAAPMPGSAA